MIKKACVVWIPLIILLCTSSLVFAWSFKKTVKDIGDLGQGVIDNVRGKESGDNLKLDRTIQKPIDAVKKPIEKADEKISEVWNEWREDKLDPIGDYIEAAYKYLKAGNEGNPDGFSTQAIRVIDAPNIQVTFNNNVLHKLFYQIVSEQIPLDKNNPNNGNYIYFDEINLSNDGERRIIVLKIARGRLKFSFVTRNTLKINGATIELSPKISKLNEKLSLDLNARLVSLNIDDVPPMVERGIAHGINDHFKNKDGENGFVSIDLTDKFGKSIKLPSVDQKNIVTSLSDSSIFIEGNTVVFQAKIEVTK
jgi:hypothetical protein